VERASLSKRVFRFGVFELDVQAGELRKHGLRVKLQDQPLQILTILLERPGEAVTREQLQQKLWAGNTFVDFDHGLSGAINKLRAALGDSAENPRFVETLSRRGYRFIAPVIRPGERDVVRTLPSNAHSRQSVKWQSRVLQRRTLVSGIALVVLAGAAAFDVWFGRSHAWVQKLY
jgi:DNA-binding winged helix-turn-helix (wHTH) protein